MQFEKIHNKGQARLFKSPYLEFLTKAHPLVIWGLYIPIISYLLYYSNTTLQFSIAKILVIFFSGIFFWSLFEYIMHRFAFHFGPNSAKAAKVVYVIHGNHHEYPRDKQRLFMPPVPSIILASTIFGLMQLIAWPFGLNAAVCSFFPGFILGYLVYGTMHYAIHAWAPPFKWLKPLWRNHHLHHYKEQERGFGVSSTLWDHVFGTMFDLKKEKEDKEKVNELMFVKTTQKNEVG